MATSGSFDFSVTRNTVIKKALQVIGAIGEGQDPTDDQYTDAAITLNMVMKSYSTEGLFDWNYQVYVLFTEASQAKYVLDNSTDLKWTIEGNLVYSALANDYTSSDSSIVADSASGSPFSDRSFSMGDTIGIRLDDDTIQWTSIASVSGTTVTLATNLTGDASTGNRVYAYSQTAHVPEKIFHVSRRDDDDHDTPLTYRTLYDYQWLSSKANEGTPTEYSYIEVPGKVRFYLWPIPEDQTYRIYILGRQYYDDFDSASDEPDIPQSWYLALTWELAALLAIEYGVDIAHLSAINRKAGMYKELAMDSSGEQGYIKFEPDFQGNVY